MKIQLDDEMDDNKTILKHEEIEKLMQFGLINKRKLRNILINQEYHSMRAVKISQLECIKRFREEHPELCEESLLAICTAKINVVIK